MSILGLRTTVNFESNERPKNWREGILRFQPNGMAPLFALTTLMSEASTDDPEFSWFEKLMPSRRKALAADITNSQTTITVASGAKEFARGHVLRQEQTEELMWVVSDPTSDTELLVSRGFAGTTATAVTVASQNPNFHMVGTAFEEGSLPPSGINFEPGRVRNYTQIFRNTLEMTRTAKKTRLRTGDQVKEAKRECMEEHARGIEMSLLFGKPSEGTANGKPIRTTGGIINYIDAANIVTHATGNVSVDDVDGYMKTLFTWGSNEKIAFCGLTALQAINMAVRKMGHYSIEAGVKEYGLKVTRILSPYGELVLKTHPLFTFHTNPATGASALDSWLLAIDQAELKYRYFTGDDMRWEQDLQENGLDGQKSGYLTECGLEIHNPKSHMLIKNLKTGVAA